MKHVSLFRYGLVAGLALAVVLAGCQTLREVANLRKVQFQIDRVADTQVAGVELRRIEAYEDLNASDVLRLTQAVVRGEVPLTFTLFVGAENPESNNVQARLVNMDWTLLLDEQETISGTFEENLVLPPGEPREIAVPMELDLVRFFGDNARDLFELALAVSGEGDPKTVMLEVQPTIDTPLGPMRYPDPITVVREEVGGPRSTSE